MRPKIRCRLPVNGGRGPLRRCRPRCVQVSGVKSTPWRCGGRGLLGTSDRGAFECQGSRRLLDDVEVEAFSALSTVVRSKIISQARFSLGWKSGLLGTFDCNTFKCGAREVLEPSPGDPMKTHGCLLRFRAAAANKNGARSPKRVSSARLLF